MKMTTFSKLLAACALLAATACASAALPSQKDVETAIRAQNWSQAESMLLDVTTQKPNNAKAWYFLAQTEEKLDKFGDAQSDLARAEKLDPSYRFASPGAVNQMEQRLASETRAVQAPVQTYHSQPAPVYYAPATHESSGLGALWVILGLIFAFFIIYAIWRAIAGPRVVTTYGGGVAGGVGYGGGYGPGGSTTVINNGGSGTGLLQTMILADAIRDEHRDHYRDDGYSSSQGSSSSWDNGPSSPAPSSDSSSFDLGGSSGGWSSSDSGSSSSSSCSSSSSSCSSSSSGSDW